MTLHPWYLLSIVAAGRINRHQQDVIEYLKEERRVLPEQTCIATPAAAGLSDSLWPRFALPEQTNRRHSASASAIKSFAGYGLRGG